jgi:predicted Zn-ribbon and HTH transcriptional regulator
MAKRKKTIIPLKVQPSMNAKLAKIARDRGQTKTKVIVKALEMYIKRYDEWMIMEKAAKTPCTECGAEVSFYHIHKHNDRCPSCGSSLRAWPTKLEENE